MSGAGEDYRTSGVPSYSGAGDVSRRGPAAAITPQPPPGFTPPTPPVYLPGFNFPAEGSQGFDLEAEADVVAGTTVSMITLNVPAGLKCRLSGVGFGADDEVALRFLSWSLLIGGDAERSYGSNLANIGSIGRPATVFVFAKDNSTVVLSVSQNAAAILTYHIVARLTGWFYQELH